MGVAHYDAPPPDVLDDIDELVADDLFREANELRAWIEVEDGRIVDCGYAGKGHIGVTRVKVGPKEMAFSAVAMPVLRDEPQVGDTWVRFVQTAGGRTSLPAPRRVRYRPFVQMASSIAWTTLALTIHADGSSEYELVGASSFPRHWIYDQSGRLVAKSGLIDFKSWYRRAFGTHTPWGAEDSPALVTEAETALERELSLAIMSRTPKPKIRRVGRDKTLVRQGDPGNELFLLLDGVLGVEVDGRPIAEFGPGSILGERALLEEGKRTATLRAITPCRVAITSGEWVEKALLSRVDQARRRLAS